jgi:N-acetylmuramoyl-L-alanine amidase
MAKIKYLILHCTATPEGREVTKQNIIDWHTAPVPKGRGWSRAGYSDLIALNGTLVNITPYDEDDDIESWEITNGATGTNSFSRHIVYAGGVTKDGKTPKDTRTTEQLLAMENYVKQVVSAYPNILVAGHNQFAPKACPSFDVPKWLKSIGISDKNIYKKL